MANTVKRATRIPVKGALAPFYSRLMALGCALCHKCNAYMVPGHAHYPFTGYVDARLFEAAPVVVELVGELETVAA